MHCQILLRIPNILFVADNPWTSPLQNTTASPPKGIGLLGRGFDIYRGNLFSEDDDIGE